MEKFYICCFDIFFFLCSFFLLIYKRSFHIDSDKIRTFSILMFSCCIHCLKQFFFWNCHGCWTDGKYSILCFIISQCLNGFFGSITHIMSDASMKMDVYKTWDHVASFRFYFFVICCFFCYIFSFYIEIFFLKFSF